MANQTEMREHAVPEHMAPTEMIPGAGFDEPKLRRPGVPMETYPPRPAGAAHWKTPERQHDPGNVLKRRGLSELTPVFSTATPPRGLSGAMRRAAYKIPEHRTSHWLLLLLADRVDVIEHEPWRVLPLVVGGMVLASAVRRYSRH